VVVNNAGYANMTPIEEIDLDDFRAQVDAVFFGTVYVTKAALPVFRAQHSGHFIQVSSIGGRLTTPGLGAYQAAKFAVEGFSGVLAQEGRRPGDQGHPRGAGRHAHRLGRLVHGGSPALPRRRADRQRDGRTASRRQRHRADRPRQGCPGIPPNRRTQRTPLHLVPGSDAIDLAAAVLQQTSDADRQWAKLGRSVDFDATGPDLPEHPPAPASG
jgi:NAD(P)-dependent dehydrogenase (short-subunit alcohol dehydrogenase family)